MKVKVGVVQSLSTSLLTLRSLGHINGEYAAQPYILTFDKNRSTYKLFFLGYNFVRNYIVKVVQF